MMRPMFLLAALASMLGGCAHFHSGAGSLVSSRDDWVQVDRAAMEFTCGLKRSGQIICWGGPHPGELSSKDGDYVQFSVSVKHLCAVARDGHVACWGSNKDGESTPPEGTFTQVAVGGQWTSRRPGGGFGTIKDECLYSCGLRPNGSVSCWGCGMCGQTSPPPGRYKQISARWHNVCGLRDDGAVDCWGISSPGILDPAPPGEYVKVVVGGFHTCALRTDRTIACWGSRYRWPQTECTKELGENLAKLRRELDDYKRAQGLEQLDEKALREAEARSVVAANFVRELTSRTTTWQRNPGLVAIWSLRSMEGAILVLRDKAIQEQYEKIYAIPPGPFIDMAGDIGFNCAIKPDRTLTCWSRANDQPDWYTPPPGTFRSLSASHNGCLCGIRTDGRMTCWGIDNTGECVPP
jgi:hypothetical protein